MTHLNYIKNSFLKDIKGKKKAASFENQWQEIAWVSCIFESTKLKY